MSITAAASSTSTVADTEPTLNRRLAVTVRFSSTDTFFSAMLAKPLAVAVMSYVPTGTFENRYEPVLSRVSGSADSRFAVSQSD